MKFFAPRDDRTASGINCFLSHPLLFGLLFVLFDWLLEDCDVRQPLNSNVKSKDTLDSYFLCLSVCLCVFHLVLDVFFVVGVAVVPVNPVTDPQHASLFLPTFSCWSVGRVVVVVVILA